MDFLELEKNQKWHNNVNITDDLKKHFGEISNYLKDKILILTLFPDKQIKIHEIKVVIMIPSSGFPK